MIVKNEEIHLKRCLESVSGVFDEIIITDTGSTDKTKEIAAFYTDKIIDFEWIDDFAAARNFSFSKAASDYIMWLDADDILPESTRTGLIELKSTIPEDTDIVRMPYSIDFSGGKPTFTFARERIIRNCPEARWTGFIHETIALFGNVINVDLPVEHHKIEVGDSVRNLRIYEHHIANGEELSPRDTFYYGRELYYHKRNQDAINAFSVFINGKKGWVENIIDACRLRSECYDRLDMPYEAMLSLLESLAYDEPRAEVCCALGLHFFNKDMYKPAIFWYKKALECTPDYNSGGFILTEYYGYIPALQLCVCYSKLGENKIALDYNEQAAKFKMTDAIRYNRKWFAGIGVTVDGN
jgi:glycosyltransferase involved in cell wall biosynthesis